MLKEFINFFRDSASSKKKEVKKATVTWKKTPKKIDAAVSRRRALKSQAKTKTNIVKKSVKRKEVSSKNGRSRRFINAFTIENKTHLLYEKSGSLYIRSLSKTGFFKKATKIDVVNNFSYDFPIASMAAVNVSQVDGKLILNYQRDDVDGKVTAFASPSEDLIFEEEATARDIQHKLVFAGTKTLHGRYVAYTGENFVYYATSDSLKQWSVKKEYLLTPRQKFFDYCGLRLIETITVKEGILLLYESSFSQDGRFYIQIGGALFEEKNPDKLLWRCDKPIWEQSFQSDDIGNASIIGASHKNRNVSAYYVINGELMTVDFAVPNFQTERRAVVIVKRHKQNPIIAPNPKNKWESKAVFNAAAIHANGKFHLLYRAIGEDDVSALGYATSKNGFEFDTRLNFPVYVPREKFEGVMGEKYSPCTELAVYESGGGCSGGCEDPRLSRVGDTIYMTYVAYNGHDVPGVAISSIKYDDFINHRWNWSKARLISRPGQMQKNWIVFPEKINGKFAILHSITPKIMVDYFDNLDEEKVYIENSFRRTDTKENRWDNIVRGAGAPPIKTKYGWLLFYHAMDKNDPNRYKIGAMILDYKNPEKILCRSRMPILEPDEKYENEGMKAGVIYVCGAVIENGMLYIYYGGADMVMCVASAKADEFLERLVTDKQTVMEKVVF